MRNIALGNENILVMLNRFGEMKDFFYPSEENHIKSDGQKMGIFCDGKFSWINNDSWQVHTNYKRNTMVSCMSATNQELGVELFCQDAVHPKENLFLRHVRIKNLQNTTREIRLFYSNCFHIRGDDSGNTGFYEPSSKSLVFYNKKRYFLVSGHRDGQAFEDYATGKFNFQGFRGTYVDAEDGALSKNPIDHGSVDGVIGFHCLLGPMKHTDLDLWVAAGESLRSVTELNSYAIKNSPASLIRDTENHWNKWLMRSKIDFADLGEQATELFKKSLFIISAHTDRRGAILASSDPAFTAIAMDNAGYYDMTATFFDYVKNITTNDGRLLPKFNHGSAQAESAHPWMKNDAMRLPVQEDENAEILFALWHHYQMTKKTGFIKSMYPGFIEPLADFMVKFRDEKTNLPKESYDIWDEKFGVHSYTCAAVYGGLMAASNLALVLKKKKKADEYRKAAEEIKCAIAKHLYDKNLKRHAMMMNYKDQGMVRDPTIDISTIYGFHEFGIADAKSIDDDIKLISENLLCPTPIGGVARYKGDRYLKIGDDSRIPGNPWIISTLWLANLYIKKAAGRKDLEPARKLIGWAASRASDSGMLPEQVNPYTGDHISTSPMIWSHSAFIDSVARYSRKFAEISQGIRMRAVA